MSIMQTGIDRRAEREYHAQVDEADIEQAEQARRRRNEADARNKEYRAHLRRKYSPGEPALPAGVSKEAAPNHAETGDWTYRINGRLVSEAQYERWLETRT